MKLLSIATAAALLAMASASFAQSTGSGVTPSATPSIGGLSECENMLGAEKEKCLQDERAGTGSTGTGAGTMGPQNTAPSGSVQNCSARNFAGACGGVIR